MTRDTDATWMPWVNAVDDLRSRVGDATGSETLGRRVERFVLAALERKGFLCRGDELELAAIVDRADAAEQLALAVTEAEDDLPVGVSLADAELNAAIAAEFVAALAAWREVDR